MAFDAAQDPVPTAVGDVAELFDVDDVTAAAGITGPGIYRHFENKEALLAAAITSGLDLVDSALSGSAQTDLEQLVAAMAEVAVLRPDMWVLLQRESRFLSPELRTAVQARFAEILESLAQRVRRDRPELTSDDARLLATATTSVLSLPATSTPRLTTAEHHRELTAAGLVCLAVDLSEPPTGPTRSSTRPDPAEPDDLGGRPQSRREQIVDDAVQLFFRYGDWTRALLASELDLDEPVAHMRVAAALTATNDLIRLGHLHERPRIRQETDRIALAVLRGHA